MQVLNLAEPAELNCLSINKYVGLVGYRMMLYILQQILKSTRLFRLDCSKEACEKLLLRKSKI